MKEMGVVRNNWKPPFEDTYKINSDGSFDLSNRPGVEVWL